MPGEIKSAFLTVKQQELRVCDDDMDQRPSILAKCQPSSGVIDGDGFAQVFEHDLAEFYTTGAPGVLQLSVCGVVNLQFGKFTALESLHLYGPQFASVRGVVACQRLHSAQFVDCYNIGDFYLLDCIGTLQTLVIMNTEAEYFPLRELPTYIVLGANNLRHKLPLRCEIPLEEQLSKRVKLFAEFNSTRPEISAEIAEKIRRERNALMAELDIAPDVSERGLDALFQRVEYLEALVLGVQRDVKLLLKHIMGSSGENLEPKRTEEHKEVESDLEI